MELTNVLVPKLSTPARNTGGMSHILSSSRMCHPCIITIFAGQFKLLRSSTPLNLSPEILTAVLKWWKIEVWTRTPGVGFSLEQNVDMLYVCE